MPQNQHVLISRCCCAVSVLALLACGSARAGAQHTTVENNGLAGKIETDYNAADKATEMRTIGPDGKLQQKVDYEYLPGYYVAQQTSTTYWPNGKIRKVAHNTYDETSNFTGEFIEVFDDSGNLVAGHKLTHDPWTAVYRCSEWNNAAHEYRNVECPSGEEQSGGASQVKKFTYDEVMHHLNAARKKAREQKISNSQPTTAAREPLPKVGQELGLIFPAQVGPGERISGTVVTNPDIYDEMPEVTVTRLALPFQPSGEASRLSGWSIEINGQKPQRADGPITTIVPRNSSGLNIALRQLDDPAHSVSKILNFSQVTAAEKPVADKSFHAPPLCLKGEVCAVSGPFNGDSGKTFAAFEDNPARILAETPEMAYVSIPDLTAPGARSLLIAEGSKVIALPVVVAEFVIRNNHRELSAGQSLLMFPTLDGPSEIPDSEWRPGNFPPTNLAQAQRLIPGFQLPQENAEDQEKSAEAGKREADEPEDQKHQENNGGQILLVVKNVQPEQISLRNSNNQMLVFHLSDQSFARGLFRYDLLAEAKQAGKVEVKGYVIPFLAPVAGQEFRIKAPAQGTGKANSGATKHDSRAVSASSN